MKSTVVERVSGKDLKGHIRKGVDPKAVIMTDDFASYRGLGKEFAAHGVVKHSKEEYSC